MISARESVPEGPGRLARGLIEYCLAADSSWTDEIRRGTAAAFAALTQDPKLVAPLLAVNNEIRAWLAADGLPAGVAEVVCLALDGLWLNWVLGATTVDKERIEQVRSSLEAVLAPHLPPNEADEETP